MAEQSNLSPPMPVELGHCEDPPVSRQATEGHFPMPSAATRGLIDRRVPGVAGVLHWDLRARRDAAAAAVPVPY